MSEAEKKSFNAEVATLRLSLVIELERELRAAANVEALRFTIVNRLRELIPYHQAVLVRHIAGKRYEVDAISNIAVIQRDAPFVAWSKSVMAEIHKQAEDEPNAVQIVNIEDIPQYLQEQAADLSAKYLLWCPLVDQNQLMMGGILLARGNPWRESELILLTPVLDCMAHCWRSFLGKKRFNRVFLRRRLWLIAFIAAFVGAMYIPVPQSALAPSEIVPYQPDVVAAPLEGVIERVVVEPNQRITPNTQLFQYEDTIFRNTLEVAKREVDLAKVELEKVTQDAFIDQRSKAEQAAMAARLAKKRAEFAFARDQYQKIIVASDREGIAIFNSPDDWVGRPVSIGQRVMLIADPERIAVDALLPVKDAIQTQEGSRVQLFLDNSPLDPIEGTVLRTSYDATLTPGSVMAFRVKVLLNEEERLPRIGARGVSKIYGEPVTLFFFLFRRPLTVLRQTIGF